MPHLLTEHFIQNELPKLMKGRAEGLFRDKRLTNFALRARRGAKGLALDFFLMTKPKIKVGDYPTFSANAAREEAGRMLRAIQNGYDPKAERAANKALPKWDDLVAAFRAKHLPKKKPGTAKRYNGVIDRVLTPPLKGKRVTDITTGMIAAFYATRASTPADANNALRVLSKMMTFAIGEGMRSTNPVKGIERYASRTRDRWLNETELPKFLNALANEQGPTGDLIRFLTVTGWRVSDARLLDWSQVNLQSLEVHLDDSATKKRARVLSADAAMLMDRQEGRAGAVFSRRGGKPIDYHHLLERLAAVCRETGIAPITPHVLRHSAATWGAIHGADLIELRDAFAWKSLAMPNRYVKTAQTVARRGAERVAAAVNIFAKPGLEILAAKR
jgi:integrase